ncbi:hypothetical protein J2X36_002130 [Methylobacterium sp. BE186]|nr:hypothetical protein [Methylobacterium sp. BE186]
MADECPMRDAWVRHCRFEPRYDESEPIFPPSLTKASHLDPRDWVRRTYVRDVCTTCGRTIERTSTKPGD